MYRFDSRKHVMLRLEMFQTGIEEEPRDRIAASFHEQPLVMVP
jgi:hypothetical protein